MSLPIQYFAAFFAPRPTLPELRAGQLMRGGKKDGVGQDKVVDEASRTQYGARPAGSGSLHTAGAKNVVDRCSVTL